MAIDRYKTKHTWGNKSFRLSSFEGDDEETRDLLVKILEQTLRDYVRLCGHKNVLEQEYFETARDWLFEPGATIPYGDFELSIDEVCTHLGIDTTWLRESLLEKTKMKKEN